MSITKKKEAPVWLGPDTKTLEIDVAGDTAGTRKSKISVFLAKWMTGATLGEIDLKGEITTVGNLLSLKGGGMKDWTPLESKYEVIKDWYNSIPAGATVSAKLSPKEQPKVSEKSVVPKKENDEDGDNGHGDVGAVTKENNAPEWVDDDVLGQRAADFLTAGKRKNKIIAFLNQNVKGWENAEIVYKEATTVKALLDSKVAGNTGWIPGDGKYEAIKKWYNNLPRGSPKVQPRVAEKKSVAVEKKGPVEAQAEKGRKEADKKREEERLAKEEAERARLELERKEKLRLQLEEESRVQKEKADQKKKEKEKAKEPDSGDDEEVPDEAQMEKSLQDAAERKEKEEKEAKERQHKADAEAKKSEKNEKDVVVEPRKEEEANDGPVEWTIENLFGSTAELKKLDLAARKKKIIEFITRNDPKLLAEVYEPGYLSNTMVKYAIENAKNAQSLGSGGNVYEKVKGMYDDRHVIQPDDEESEGPTDAEIKMNALESENDRLRSTIKNKERDEQVLKNNMGKLQKELGDLKIQLSEAQKNVNDLENTTRDVNSEKEKAEKALEDIKTKNAQLNVNVLQAQKQKNAFQLEKEAAELALTEATANYTRLQQDLTQDKLVAERDRNDAQEKLKLANGTITRLESEKTTQQSQLDQAAITEKDQKTTIARLTEKVTELETKQPVGSDAEEKLKTKIVVLENQITAQQRDTKEAELQVTDIINDRNQTIKEKENSITELEAKLATETNLKKDAMENQKTTETARSVLETTVNTLKAEKKSLEDRITNLESEVSKYTAASLSVGEKDIEIVRLNDQLKTAKAELETTRNTLAQLQADKKAPVASDESTFGPFDLDRDDFYLTKHFDNEPVYVKTTLEDLVVIGTHWAHYRLLRINVNGKSVPFYRFIEDDLDLKSGPVDDPTVYGFRYEIVTTGAKPDNNSAIVKSKIAPDGFTSRALTMSDHMAMATLGALVPDAVGEYSIRLRFFDDKDRPVLGFVASQLAMHALAPDHYVITLDMEKNASNLTYTDVTPMGRRIITNPGRLQVAFAVRGVWSPDSHMLTFNIQPPSVVDERFAFGIPAITEFGDGDVELKLLTTYVTPGLASLEHFTLRSDEPFSLVSLKGPTPAVKKPQRYPEYVVLYPDERLEKEFPLMFSKLTIFLRNHLAGRNVVAYDVDQNLPGATIIFTTFPERRDQIKSKPEYTAYAEYVHQKGSPERIIAMQSSGIFIADGVDTLVLDSKYEFDESATNTETFDRIRKYLPPLPEPEPVVEPKEIVAPKDASNYVVLYPDDAFVYLSQLFTKVVKFLADRLDGRKVVEYEKGQNLPGATLIFVANPNAKDTKKEIEAKQRYMDYMTLKESDPIIIAVDKDTRMDMADVYLLTYDASIQFRDSEPNKATIEELRKALPNVPLLSGASITSLDASSPTVYEIVEMTPLSDMDSLSEAEDYFGEEW